MKKTDPYKLLRIISLILGIICMLLMLKGKVLAAGIDDTEWTYINGYFVEANNYSDADDYLNWIKENHSDFIIWEDSDMVFIITYAFENFGILFNVQNDQTLSVTDLLTVDNSASKLSRDYVSNGCLTNHSYTDCPNIDVGSWVGDECVASFIHYNKTSKTLSLEYLAQYFIGSTSCAIYEYNGSDGFEAPYNLYVYGGAGYDRRIRHITGGQILFGYNTIYPQSFSHTYEHVGASGSVLVPYKGYQTTTVSGFDNYMLVDTDIYHYNDIPNSNTEGFNVYTFGSSGSEELILDFTNCIAIDPATSQYSEATIVIDINGTETTFNLDSESAYYNFSDTTNRHAWYQIPFTYFSINDNDNARLKSVYIENTTSAHGGYYTTDIYWFTEIQLTGSDITPLEPEDINVSSDYPPITNAEIAANTYMVEFNSLAGLNNFDFRAATLPDAYDQDMARVYIYSGNIPYSDFLAWFDPSGVIEDIIGYFNNVSTIDQAETIINSYLEDNAFTCTYSGILFVWVDQNSTSQVVNPENCTYWFYPTVSGRIKAVNFLLNDMNTDISRQLDIMSKLENYLEAKLDDFEEKTLDGFNAQMGLISNTNSILNKLQNALKRIIELLQNLDIEFPEADYSSIISAINGVKSAIENQNSGNIDTDSYQGFKAWLFDINEQDAILSPHEFAKDSLDTIKGFFEWSTSKYYPSASAEFFQRARDYVTFLNGTNDQYHNYSTGIVNGNYDPHDINGIRYP